MPKLAPLSRKYSIETLPVSYAELGRMYGISRQAVHYYAKYHNLKKKEKVRGHQFGVCPLCQAILQVSYSHFSEYQSTHTIREKVKNLCDWKKLGLNYIYHLGFLKCRGLVKEKFGHMRSPRTEKAFELYLHQVISPYQIGKIVGYKNFWQTLVGYKERGWDVPPSLFVYNAEARRKAHGGWPKGKPRKKIPLDKDA